MREGHLRLRQQHNLIQNKGKDLVGPQGFEPRTKGL